MLRCDVVVDRLRMVPSVGDRDLLTRFFIRPERREYGFGVERAYPHSTNHRNANVASLNDHRDASLIIGSQDRKARCAPTNPQLGVFPINVPRRLSILDLKHLA